MPTDINSVFAWLLANAPLAVLPVVALWVMYNDAKKERADSRAQTDALLVQVTLMSTYLQLLAQALQISLPSREKLLQDLADEGRISQGWAQDKKDVT